MSCLSLENPKTVHLKTNVSSKWKIGAVSSQNIGAGHFVLLRIWTVFFLVKIIHHEFEMGFSQAEPVLLRNKVFA